jgi:predicted transcriptional regulator
MSASTVKLEADILRRIDAVKPRNQTLAAYVREALERDVLRRQLRTAAERYQAFLSENVEESQELEEWERAPLATAPRRARR